jgi:hypothetical protein
MSTPESLSFDAEHQRTTDALDGLRVESTTPDRYRHLDPCDCDDCIAAAREHAAELDFAALREDTP